MYKPNRIGFLSVLVTIFWVSSSWGVERVLFVARHGETGTNQKHLLVGQQLHPDAVLTPKGKKQAEVLATLLKDVGIQRVYVSRLKRTHQTAQPLAAKLGLTPFVRSQLDEINFGRIEGRSYKDKEIRELLHRTDRDCAFRPGNGESPEDLVRRVGELRSEIIRTGAPQTVLWVAHYGIVRATLDLFLNLECEEAGKIVPQNGDVFRLELENGQVTKFFLSEAGKPFRELTREALLGRAGRLP